MLHHHHGKCINSTYSYKSVSCIKRRIATVVEVPFYFIRIHPVRIETPYYNLLILSYHPTVITKYFNSLFYIFIMNQKSIFYARNEIKGNNLLGQDTLEPHVSLMNSRKCGWWRWWKSRKISLVSPCIYLEIVGLQSLP